MAVPRCRSRPIGLVSDLILSRLECQHRSLSTVSIPRSEESHTDPEGLSDPETCLVAPAAHGPWRQFGSPWESLADLFAVRRYFLTPTLMEPIYCVSSPMWISVSYIFAGTRKTHSF